MTTTEQTLAQEITKFIGDPSPVLDAATADPEWAKEPIATLKKHLAKAGYSEEAQRQIGEGALHMDTLGTEFLSALGLT